jgi:Rieske 2Fe-2S family protein
MLYRMLQRSGSLRRFVPESVAMNVLTKTVKSLPASWYHDTEHYRRELDAIWYREWLCVGRLEDLARPRDYALVEIGNQKLIVTRDDNNKPKVFHNTCRHRGSILCTETRGRFRSGRIICPYHTWTYDLGGALVATPSLLPSDDFDPLDFPLYDVHSDIWGGYLFVNLADNPETTLAEFLGDEARLLDRWPLQEMISVQQDRRELACNWKLFWENYSECYHCPRVHPELCKLVPLYQSGVLNYADVPGWEANDKDDNGRPRVAPGLETWMPDGKRCLPQIPGLSDADIAAGVTFASFTASMFVVAHPDYVRSVRILPRGPESCELIVDWLLLPEVAASQVAILDDVFAVGRMLVEQDGRVCEINQLGLKSLRHEHGVLVPQEYALYEFHEWLRQRLDIQSGMS